MSKRGIKVLALFAVAAALVAMKESQVGQGGAGHPGDSKAKTPDEIRAVG